MLSTYEDPIVQNARRIGLDIEMDAPTLGDGNCWYRAIVQQMTRPEIFQLLDRCQICDHHVLRLAVVNYIREQEQFSHFIQNYHRIYDQTIHEEYGNMTWHEFLCNQEQNGVYCTELFLKATAVFLSIDILITSENSTIRNPYTRLGRSWEETINQSPCPMIIGNISQNHFQSLIPSPQILAINSGTAVNNSVDFIVTHQSYANVCRITKTPQKLNKQLSDRNSPTFCKKNKLNTNLKEVELERSCLEWGVKYVPACDAETQKQQKNRRERLRRAIKLALKTAKTPSKTKTNFETEVELERSCLEWGVKYVPACDAETQKQQKNRRERLRRAIKLASKTEKEASKTNFETEVELERSCLEWGVKYVPACDAETQKQQKNRRERLRRAIKLASKTEKEAILNIQKNRLETNVDIIDDIDISKEQPADVETTDDVMMEDVTGNLHSNPAVEKSIKDFEEGELLHSIAECKVCKETRPVFHMAKSSTTYSGSKCVETNPWKLNKQGVCDRCHKERLLLRKKKNLKPSKFSGVHSLDEHLGPASNPVRHNNMHFIEIPPFLTNLTTVEIALISRINVIMNVHVLRYGMLASKGHCISLPQEMKIAAVLPLLPEEVGIVILKRKGSNEQFKEYSVDRQTVETALRGLCYGLPHGGESCPQDNYKRYDGPDHINTHLYGKFFRYLPNQFYKDVNILESRLSQLPEIRQQLSGLKVMYIPDTMTENDKGPAPAQSHLENDEFDESTTTSGIACPADPKDAQKELQKIFKTIVGSSVNVSGDQDEVQTASTNWEYNRGEPLNELKTPGFFTMAFPTVFINGSCDITIPGLVDINFNEYIEHIYFTNDNRVSKHPHLKFVLLNLRLRKQALSQGSYLVSQQLNDAHLSVEQLRKCLENNDDCVPRKIISMGSNLQNTHPFWRDRKRELDNVLYYRLKEHGDMPAYFDTMSCAEYFCQPLLQLLSKYHAQLYSECEQDVREKMNTDFNFRRQIVLDNLHIVTSYFNTRTINYYATIMKETLQYDDIWWRYEFAKSRGAIHSHAVVSSTRHADKIKEALDGENSADQLWKWLQTTELDSPEDNVYSPGFVSMHPAGGIESTSIDGQKEWVPNKSSWSKPEGTQAPPDVSPLTQSLNDIYNTGQFVEDHYVYLVNRVAIHLCNAYCLRLRRKKKDADGNKINDGKKYCRFHFGDVDPVTKKTPGKECHPFEARIEEGAHPRFEGPRDHPRLVSHIKIKLLTWLANCDTQPLVDQNLLALLQYITGYACKGNSSTEDLIQVYKYLLDTIDVNATSRSVAQKLLMKLVGMVDVSGACADYMNTGGMLYHSTRRTTRIGLSGYRMLDVNGKDGNLTRSTPLDKFLSDERREKQPNITLWDWAKKCNCNKSNKCGVDHAPVFTGVPMIPVWPISEDYCKYQMMIYSPGTWKKVEELKGDYDTYSDAFAEFLDSEDCPQALKKILDEAKENFEKKKRTASGNKEKDAIAHASQFSCESQSTSSQLSQLNLGAALLRDLATANKESLEKLNELPILQDGGPDFDWHEYGIQCLGVNIPDNTKDWMQNMSTTCERAAIANGNDCNLPKINLLLANSLQRVIIAINLHRMLDIKKNGYTSLQCEPIRLVIQGTAGVGKTFVITALTYIVRRLFGRNDSVLNLAPTGAASVLLPDGHTMHSITPVPRDAKATKGAQLSDFPMSDKPLQRLRQITGTHDKFKLMCLNLDERGMFSSRMVAWCSQRFSESTGSRCGSFGNIPVVNFFGDLGQLGPVAAKDLHVQPSKAESTEKIVGYAIYRSFDQCVLLQQSMRQGPDQLNLLNRLLRIRNGSITQQDWLDINNRYEKELSHNEQKNFSHNKTLTLMETWNEVNEENHFKLSKLGVPFDFWDRVTLLRVFFSAHLIYPIIMEQALYVLIEAPPFCKQFSSVYPKKFPGSPCLTRKMDALVFNVPSFFYYYLH